MTKACIQVQLKIQHNIELNKIGCGCEFGCEPTIVQVLDILELFKHAIIPPILLPASRPAPQIPLLGICNGP